MSKTMNITNKDRENKYSDVESNYHNNALAFKEQIFFSIGIHFHFKLTESLNGKYKPLEHLLQINITIKEKWEPIIT